MVLLFAWISVPAQKSTIRNNPKTAKDTTVSDVLPLDIICIYEEKQAEFPGGFSKLNKFLKENMQYPELAKEYFIYGDVRVLVTINEDGTVAGQKILQGNPYLNEEALRLIKLMPRWIPATCGGKPIKSKVVIPVSFHY